MATAPARKRTVNLMLRKSRLCVGGEYCFCLRVLISGKVTYHSMKVVDLIGARSLINQAAGKPVAKVIMPMIRNDHSAPSFRISPSIAKLMTVPPIPPPA